MDNKNILRYNKLFKVWYFQEVKYVSVLMEIVPTSTSEVYLGLR